MKIKVKGFKSLIKAVQNRAHLFPVKVLVNGKTKSYYSIRYKTGNKAMDIAKKQMKIPDTVEALFDTKDGKKKNLTENDVLRIYDKAGKPGSLQDFIKKNFKKPYAKPRNSTTADLEQQQMSIDDLMQGKQKEINDKDVEDKETSEKEQRLSNYGREYHDGSFEIDIENIGGVYDEKDKEVEEATELRRSLAFQFNNEVNYMKNNASFSDLSTYETVKKDYLRHKELESILKNKELKHNIIYSIPNKPPYWIKAAEVGVNNLNELLDFDNDYKNGKYDKDPVKTEILNILGIKPNNESDATKLKPKLSALKKLIGKKGNVINGKQLTERASKEIDQVLKNATFNLSEMKITVESGNNYLQNLLDEALNRKVEEIKAETQGSEPVEPEEPENIKEPEKEKLAFRNVGMDGGLINFIKMREGTTRVESKGEYKQVKNINELVNQIKPLKDSHTKIKGRAIMDMFGIDADLYVKAGNIPFPLGKGAVGYCTKAYDPKTDRSSILEIGLVADRDNVVAETKTAIHECMHAQLKHSIDKTVDEYPVKNEKRKEIIRHNIEETIVEMAGQGVSNLIHGNGTDKELWSYTGIVAQVAPMIWGTPEFAEARKKGLHGIGQEICKKLINNDTSFIQNVVSEYFESQIDNELNGKITNRMQTIEWAITGNENKVEKIQNDTGKSDIANLVEELKKGTISLEGALNSSQYRELAAILITKFLEDEDLDILEDAANEIKYGNAESAEMMASGRIPF